MPSWILQSHAAVLNHAGLHGSLDLLQPAQGIAEISLMGAGTAARSILGVNLPSPKAEAAEAYVRGGDLVATYAESPVRPARVQVYWRVPCDSTGPIDSPVTHHAVDLQISVQTSQLGIATPIETISRVRAGAAWRLTDVERGDFAPLRLSAESHTLKPEQGPGCLLFRLPGSDWSYAEMIHPADFCDSELILQPGETALQPELTLKHRLFPEPLEKGVILRGQLRGVWLPRDNDHLAAAAAYHALLEMPPPLTT